MTLVEWRDEFNIGIEEVDFEHRELIDLINASYAAAKQGEPATAVMDFLGEIFEKISAHFALEEAVMRKLGYDELAEHKQDHEHLLDSIMDIMDACMHTPAIDEEALGRDLREWFVHHFRTKDARLHHFLQH